uniref:Uncharacterized protein n=1 Tax=Onchocerca volvulus TaxID=6282 RepID=A0A8R1TK09_ONCVO
MSSPAVDFVLNTVLAFPYVMPIDFSLPLRQSTDYSPMFERQQKFEETRPCPRPGEQFLAVSSGGEAHYCSTVTSAY